MKDMKQTEIGSKNSDGRTRLGCKGCLIGPLYLAAYLLMGPGMFLLVFCVPAGVVSIGVPLSLIALGVGFLVIAEQLDPRVERDNREPTDTSPNKKSEKYISLPLPLPTDEEEVQKQRRGQQK